MMKFRLAAGGRTRSWNPATWEAGEWRRILADAALLLAMLATASWMVYR